MKKYRCRNCNDLECETSICPNCNCRTELMSTEIYWCKECNIPVYYDTCPICNNKLSRVGSDLRPVFPEERLLLEVLIDKPMEFAGKSVWNTSGNRYVVDGKKLKLKVSDLIKKDNKLVIEELKKYKEENQKYVDIYYETDYIKKYIEANKRHLNFITKEASDYIKGKVKDYSPNEMFVSFSGGKDSTVTSHLVMTALEKKEVIHIYGNTTLEYPESIKYVERFKKENPRTPMLVAENKEQNFNDLCKLVGPPSRVMRWCCTIFKTGAITRKIESTFKNKKSILTFYGIRRSESASRSKYERDSESPKITKQHVASPIIDWLDFDVWLYLISNKVDFNDAYRKGFTRVGCWCCPNNSDWSAYLSSVYMKEQYDVFYNILLDFAKKVGKKDAKVYVATGKWKARQGGNGVAYSKNAIVDFKPCALEENTLNFELSKPVDESLYTFFKPFGKLDFNMGNKRLNEVFILNKRTEKPILKISGKIGQNIIKISILDSKFGKSQKDAQMLLKNQITKYQTCIACLGCEAVCKFNAIKISKIGDKINYTIDENKCVNCLECVRHFPSGCYMKRVLRTKEDK